jgi:murein DD-endopeptidase MepM/ murein hydrolase activator NlpD
MSFNVGSGGDVNLTKYWPENFSSFDDDGSPRFGIDAKDREVVHVGRIKPKHRGIDVFGKIGEPVFAVVDGHITYAGMTRGDGGNVIILATQQPVHDIDPIAIKKEDPAYRYWKRHKIPYVYPQDTKFIRYAHLNSINVRPGETVLSGQEIGGLGDTGSASRTKAHIHFSIYGTAGEPIYYSGERTKIINAHGRSGKPIKSRFSDHENPYDYMKPLMHELDPQWGVGYKTTAKTSSNINRASETPSAEVGGEES